MTEDRRLKWSFFVTSEGDWFFAVRDLNRASGASRLLSRSLVLHMSEKAWAQFFRKLQADIGTNIGAGRRRGLRTW